MEFDPLLPAGFHDISKEDVYNLFVEPFVIKERREYLVKRLNDFLDKYEITKLNSEIWIDGSFVSKKPDPNDIDIVFFLNREEVNNLSDESKLILKELFANNSETKARYSLDVYFICEINNEQDKMYWRGCFGFSRNNIPKGIPRLILNFN